MLSSSPRSTITDPLGHDAMVADGARLAISCGCSRCERSGASVRQPVASCSEAGDLRSPLLALRAAQARAMQGCAPVLVPRAREGAAVSSRHVRALRRPGRRAVPARGAVAVHRAPRAVRHRRLGLGRIVGDERRQPLLVPRHPGLPRRSGARRSGRSRDDRGARPPAAALETLDARHPRHPAVRRPGRPLRVQPQRRPPRDRAWRKRYRDQGRIHGKADTEVGARWLEDRWNGTARRRRSSHELHDQFEGQANLATISAGGDVATMPATPRTPSSRSASGGSGSPSTGIYSLDRSLFRFAAPEATERRLVRVGGAVALDRNGGAGPGVVGLAGGG